MRILRLTTALVIVTVVVLTVTAGAPKHRKALRILRLLKEVDGAGSGLDADTVRGLTPLVIVDVNGRVVGTWVGEPGASPTFVVRRLDGNPVELTLTRDGFEQGARFYYESEDCSGKRLLPVSGDVMPNLAVVLGHTAYYPLNPTVRSSGSYSDQPVPQCPLPGGTFLPPDTCCTRFPHGLPMGRAIAFDLDSLGLVPPFHLDVP